MTFSSYIKDQINHWLDNEDEPSEILSFDEFFREDDATFISYIGYIIGDIIFESIKHQIKTTCKRCKRTTKSNQD